MLKSSQFLAMSAAMLCLLAASEPAIASAEDSIEIKFAAQVNGEAFECGKSYPGAGASRKTVTPSDFRLFISEVSVLTNDGRQVPVRLRQDKVWQLDEVALLDFENGRGPCGNGTPATNMSIKGTVPRGTYNGLRFTIGVPVALNHSDPTTAAAPLSTTAMFWNWQGGYKFIKFDSTAQAAPQARDHQGAQHHEASAAFAFHLGSTQCAAPQATPAAARCQQANRVPVELRGSDPRQRKVVIDIGRILESTDVGVNSPNSPPGCMSSLEDPDCHGILQRLGLMPAANREVRVQQLVSW